LNNPAFPFLQLARPICSAQPGFFPLRLPVLASPVFFRVFPSHVRGWTDPKSGSKYFSPLMNLQLRGAVFLGRSFFPVFSPLTFFFLGRSSSLCVLGKKKFFVLFRFKVIFPCDYPTFDVSPLFSKEVPVRLPWRGSCVSPCRSSPRKTFLGRPQLFLTALGNPS